MHQYRYRPTALASALLLAMAAPFAASAQDAPSPEPAPSAAANATEIDKVTVTGSRIRRVETEGPLPVQIITDEQIRREGFVTVYDMLTTLNEAIGTVEADLQWGSHTPNASPINLRNMGPGRSLLLVNGRRVADYPLPYGGQSNFANYSNIPTAAVARVEVLTGGASAIYGSDAVAGVINVILRDDYEGDQFRIRGGTSTEGGRDVWSASWAGGKAGPQWSLSYSLQYMKRDPLFGRDRPRMDDTSDAPPSSWNMEQRAIGFRPNTGLAILDAITGDRLPPPPGTCEKFNGEYFLANRKIWQYPQQVERDTGWLCGKTAAFSDWLIMSGSEDASGYLRGTWDFGGGLKGWANLAVYDSEGIWSTSPPGTQLPDGLDGIAYIDSKDPTRRPLIGVRQFTPREAGNLKRLRNLSKEFSWDFSTGLSGSFADGRFDWEASLGRSRYTVDERISTIHWQRVNDFFLGPVIEMDSRWGPALPVHDVDLDRWWNPITPDEYDQFLVISRNKASSWVNQGAFTINGDLFQGWAGPIGFAAVLETAKQGYRLGPDPLGNIEYSVQNINRGGGERTRWSAGAELSIPLHESLTATVAARHDRYGSYKAFVEGTLDVGSQSETTYNLGLQWRPVASLMLRGSYATSFRAPDMHYLLAQPSTSAVTNLDHLRCIQTDAYLTNDCVATNTNVSYAFNINRRGTPDLASELGKSWTAGFVWDALDNLSVTADYWSIKLEDEIRDIGQGTILRDEAGCLTGRTIDPAVAWSNPGGSEYCDSILSRVTRDANGRITDVERGPINIAQKEVTGFDISARYQFQMATLGNFQVGINYTNLRSLYEQTYRTDPNPNRRDRDIRSKIRGSISWQKGDWNATVYGDRIGSVPGVRYHWGADRLDNPGGCLPFPDGYVPSDSIAANCSEPALLPNGQPNPNPNAGQSTGRYYGRVGPAITWNFTGGYRINEAMRINLYVSNVFNSAGWNHKDPYKLDYEFYNSRLYSPVGREWSLEYVFNFN